MVDPGLAPRSALAGFIDTGHQGRAATVGVTIAERRGFDIVTVAAHRGQGTAVAAAMREAFGLDLPVTPRRVGDGRLALLWAGDARWTAVSECGDDRLEMLLRDHLKGLAAITGQGDGRVVLRVTGPSARDVLGKAVAIDLHPPSLSAGRRGIDRRLPHRDPGLAGRRRTDLRSVGRPQHRRKSRGLAGGGGAGIRRRRRQRVISGVCLSRWRSCLRSGPRLYFSSVSDPPELRKGNVVASSEHAPGFVPDHGTTQEDWNEVSDHPEIMEEQWALARPLAETRPELVAAMRRGRGSPGSPTKDLVSLRLDKDMIATLRAGGSGWQSRANDLLRKGLGLDGAAEAEK